VPNSVRDVLSSATSDEIDTLLNRLSPNALVAMPYLFELWGLEGHQLAPQSDWLTWVILGGRGAGKTRAGAEWVREQVEGARPNDAGRCSRVALVGETLDQARDVMVFGASGILACSPPDRRPEWQATRRRLVWPNGAQAQIFSASDPEALRGPQFDCAWCDELAKWKKGQEAWDMLQFALRLGETPRQVITTTPRANALLECILEAPRTAVTSAPTRANARNLSPVFLEQVMARYDGTALGRQELEGELVRDLPGAMWSRAAIEAARVDDVPPLERIVVAIDPPVTSGSDADACGIVVAGVVCEGPPQDWKAYVLEDASLTGATPTAWIKQAVARARHWGADRIIAEVNQGGDLIETLLRQVDPLMPYRGVNASRGKATRAEPVAALYEQGRAFHAAPMLHLEDQMCAMARHGYTGKGSPDRLDALVWALTELMIVPAQGFRAPQMRVL
jgi:phage terminase large subunit-like protein